MCTLVSIPSTSPATTLDGSNSEFSALKSDVNISVSLRRRILNSLEDKIELCYFQKIMVKVMQDADVNTQRKQHGIQRHGFILRSSLGISALRTCVYIYIQQLSSFRAPMLWFIDLTVATCHIQYTFLSLCQFVSRENGQNTKILSLPFSYDNTKMAADSSLYTKRSYLESFLKGWSHP